MGLQRNGRGLFLEGSARPEWSRASCELMRFANSVTSGSLRQTESLSGF